MNQLLFLLLFSALGMLYFFLGWRASKHIKTNIDYYLAGRKLGIIAISCNLIATQLGGGLLLGTAEQAYTKGIFGILYTLGMSIGFLLLGLGIAARLQQFQVTTVAQLFETQYRSTMLKKIASLLSIITMFGILVAQAIGFKKLMYNTGFTQQWVGDLFWLSVVGYTMLGGLRAITINDMVQLAIITTVFGGLFLYNIFSDPASLSSLVAYQQSIHATIPSWYELFPIIVMPALFSLIEQDLAQRFFSSRSPRVATISAFIASLFLLLFSFIPIYFGMKAYLVGIPLNEHSSPLVQMLAASTHQFIFALALCAIVAAIISTADALTNGIGANITQDFDFSWLGIKNKLLFSKLVSGLVGTGALLASYVVSKDIIGIIIDSYAISVSCLLVPLLYCMFKKEVHQRAAFFAVIGGLIGFVGFSIYTVPFPKELIALALSWIGFVIGSAVAKKSYA